MNVLFLTTSYPTPERPIDGIFVREHARAAADVADVRVVYLERATGAAVPRLESLAGEDPPAWRVRYRRFGRPISVGAFLAAPRLTERSFHRTGWRPDVVHAHSFLAVLAAATLRLPIAYTEHWSIFLADSPRELSPSMRLAARMALRRADAVLPVSAAAGRGLQQIAPINFQVVPNVVDERVFHARARRKRKNGVRLLTAGLLDTPQKRVDLVLEALDRLETRGVRLDVVGDGAQRPAYEALASRLGLDGAVAFHGLRTKAELAQLMRESDLFVLGSEYENNPCVAIEALACGLPLVAARAGGIPEVVDDDAGVLVEPGDVESLAAGIETALQRLDRFDRSALAARAKSRYGRVAIAQQLATIYRDLTRATR